MIINERNWAFSTVRKIRAFINFENVSASKNCSQQSFFSVSNWALMLFWAFYCFSFTQFLTFAIMFPINYKTILNWPCRKEVVWLFAPTNRNVLKMYTDQDNYHWRFFLLKGCHHSVLFLSKQVSFLCLFSITSHRKWSFSKRLTICMIFFKIFQSIFTFTYFGQKLRGNYIEELRC